MGSENDQNNKSKSVKELEAKTDHGPKPIRNEKTRTKLVSTRGVSNLSGMKLFPQISQEINKKTIYPDHRKEPK